MIYDVAIIGAGASGMMAGICALKNGKKTVLIDHMKMPGKKLTTTGNGKCNYTNLNIDTDLYNGDDTELIKSVYDRFDNQAAIDFFKGLGVLPLIKNGYVYPMNGSAHYFKDIMEEYLKRNGATMATDMKVLEITKSKNFLIKTSYKSFEARKVIMASGGLAGKNVGSDGTGYALMESFGHSVIDPVPALCALVCHKYPNKKSSDLFMISWAKIRTNGTLTVYINGKEVMTEKGEIQLTDYGVSGIPAFQISSLCSRALHDEKRVEIKMDIMPDYTESEIKEYLYSLKAANNYTTYFDMVKGFVHEKLLVSIFKYDGIEIKEKISSGNDWIIDKVAFLLKNIKLYVNETVVFAHAQVSSGGIPLKEFNADTLESKICPGLYAAGEILNVDGPCGGYNLQWAWSSGYITGNAI